jgi:hypothetical protein
MEFNGITVAPAVVKDLSVELAERTEQLYGELQTLAGIPFNPDSPQQLAEVLFDRLGLPVVKRTKLGLSTDVEVLEELADRHPLPAKIVEYRQLMKLRNTYADALLQQICPRTGRVHTSFMQDVARTGRLSSKDPNLQNIPIRTATGRRIRQAFVAGGPDQLLITADYSQIELRVLAHFCEDPVLLSAFERDEDIHRVVAAQVYGIMSTSPHVGFGRKTSGCGTAITPDFRMFVIHVGCTIIIARANWIAVRHLPWARHKDTSTNTGSCGNDRCRNGVRSRSCSCRGDDGTRRQRNKSPRCRRKGPTHCRSCKSAT